MSDSSSDTPNPCEKLQRRTFFQRLFLCLTGGMGLLAVTAFSVPFVAYLMGSLRKKSPPWVPLDLVNNFPKGNYRLVSFVNPMGQPWDGMTANNGVYVRYLGADGEGKDSFLVFSVNCAHLGCPVEWFPQSGLFMCPCHGGVYYENGDRASGPPPRGLYQCDWRVNDGVLEILAPHYPTLQNTLRGKA
jgi:menaquinol-cytochrome c reductase iron-sulfur subunit